MRKSIVVCFALTLSSIGGLAAWRIHAARAPVTSGLSANQEPQLGSLGKNSLAVEPGRSRATESNHGLWPINSELDYDLDFSSRFENTAGSGEWLTLTGSGTLSVRVAGASAGETKLIGHIADFSAFTATAKREAMDAGDALRPELATPFVMLIDGNGALKQLQVSTRAAGQGQGVLRAIVSSLQFVRPTAELEKQKWYTREIDHQGKLRVMYEMLGAREYKKTKLDYSQLSTGSSLGVKPGSQTINADIHYWLDAKGWIARLQSNESSVLPLQRDALKCTFTLTLVLKNVREARSIASLPPDLAPAPLFGSVTSEQGLPDSVDRLRELVRNASFDELSGELKKGSTPDERFLAMNRMTALFKLEPNRIADAKRYMAKSPYGQEHELLLGALADAETTPAQDALLDIGLSAEQDERSRQGAIRQLGLLEKPTDKTIAGLRALSHDSSDPDTQQASTLALGSAARAAGEGSAEALKSHQDLSARAEAATTQEERQLLLGALGNAGSASDLPYLKRALKDPDAGIRSTAVLALRFVPGAEVDALVATTLQQDPDAAVRLSAVTAFAYREPSAAADFAMAQALLVDVSESVRVAICTHALPKLPSLPKVVSAMDAARTKDPSDKVRRAAEDGLQKLSG